MQGYHLTVKAGARGLRRVERVSDSHIGESELLNYGKMCWQPALGVHLR